MVCVARHPFLLARDTCICVYTNYQKLTPPYSLLSPESPRSQMAWR